MPQTQDIHISIMPKTVTCLYQSNSLIVNHLLFLLWCSAITGYYISSNSQQHLTIDYRQTSKSPQGASQPTRMKTATNRIHVITQVPQFGQFSYIKYFPTANFVWKYFVPRFYLHITKLKFNTSCAVGLFLYLLPWAANSCFIYPLSLKACFPRLYKWFQGTFQKL